MNTVSKLMRLVTTLIPLLLISVICSNILYISVISVLFFPITPPLSFCIYLIIMAGTSFWIYRQKSQFIITKVSVLAIVLGALTTGVLMLRFSFLYPGFDDRNFHLIISSFLWNLWNSNHFLPAHGLTFMPGNIQLIYAPLAETLGLRLTLLVLYMLFNVWYVSLYIRYAALIKGFKGHSILFLSFCVIFFLPATIQSYALFMPDFLSLIVALEAILQYVRKDGDKTFATLLAVITIFIKVSTGIFLIPLYGFFYTSHIRKINTGIVLAFLILSSLFYVRMYLEIGTPTFGLLNNVFQSPIYSTIDSGVGKDARWGPENVAQGIIWPFYGQFTTRFDEMSTVSPRLLSDKVTLFFSIVLAFPFVISLFLFFFTKRWVYLVVFISFLIWSFFIGYSRYVVPLFGISTVLCVIGLVMYLPMPRLLRRTPDSVFAVITCIVVIISLNSIHVDLGFRPHPKAIHDIFIKGDYYMLLRSNLPFLLKDTPSQIGKDLQADFSDKTVIVPNQKDQALSYLYAYFASTQDKNIVFPIYNQRIPDLYRVIINSNKVSTHLKDNLRQLEKCDEILVVSEEKSQPHLKNYVLPAELPVLTFCDCKPVKPAGNTSLITGSAFFSAHFMLYTCMDKSNSK